MNKIETNMTINVKIMGKVETLTVYKIPIEELFYNDRNDRISSFINEFGSKIKDLSQIDKQSKIEEFIEQSNPAALKTTKDSIMDDGQMKAGIIASDGRVLDGNRRFTCLRQLFRKYKIDKYKYFHGAVLDGKLASLSEVEIKKIEYNLQFAEEKRVDYDTINLLVGMYNSVIMPGINDDNDPKPLLSPDEYVASKKIKMAEFKKDKRTIEIMIDYLHYINRPYNFYIARDAKLKEAFTAIAEGLKKIKADEETINKLKEICFSILVANANVNVSLTHTVRKLLSDYKKNSRTYLEIFEEYDELADDIFDELIGEEGFSEDKQINFFKTDSYKNFTKVLNGLLENTTTENIKDQPINDLEYALKKVAKIDLDIVRVLDADRNNIFVKHLEELNTEIQKMLGEFDVKL